jgi:hypothetical protein
MKCTARYCSGIVAQFSLLRFPEAMRFINAWQKFHSIPKATLIAFLLDKKCLLALQD